MNTIGSGMQKGTSRFRERTGIRPWHIVLFIVLLIAAAAIQAWIQTSIKAGPAFVCPEAPAPFELRQNFYAEVDGSQVYFACAWVGALPAETPLP